MSTLHEQARAEAEKRYPEPNPAHPGFIEGFRAGHEAAHADDDARIVRLVGVVTATTMLGPDDAETVVRALVAHESRPGQVTTVEELDALPDGAVMRTKSDDLCETGSLPDGTRVVWASGWSTFPDAVQYLAPLAVLYVPEG